MNNYKQIPRSQAPAWACIPNTLIRKMYNALPEPRWASFLSTNLHLNLTP